MFFRERRPLSTIGAKIARKRLSVVSARSLNHDSFSAIVRDFTAIHQLWRSRLLSVLNNSIRRVVPRERKKKARSGAQVAVDGKAGEKKLEKKHTRGYQTRPRWFDTWHRSFEIASKRDACARAFSTFAANCRHAVMAISMQEASPVSGIAPLTMAFARDNAARYGVSRLELH